MVYMRAARAGGPSGSPAAARLGLLPPSADAMKALAVAFSTYHDVKVTHIGEVNEAIGRNNYDGIRALALDAARVAAAKCGCFPPPACPCVGSAATAPAPAPLLLPSVVQKLSGRFPSADYSANPVVPSRLVSPRIVERPPVGPPPRLDAIFGRSRSLLAPPRSRRHERALDARRVRFAPLAALESLGAPAYPGPLGVPPLDAAFCRGASGSLAPLPPAPPPNAQTFIDELPAGAADLLKHGALDLALAAAQLHFSSVVSPGSSQRTANDIGPDGFGRGRTFAPADNLTNSACDLASDFAPPSECVARGP